MKKEKIRKNKLFTKYPDQTSHTVETRPTDSLFFVQAVHLVFIAPVLLCLRFPTIVRF